MRLALVSHPEVEGTASDRVERYFSKDVIEKDFESIKSVLKLRPVRHRTDPKLRAHVCICVLALLLTRVERCDEALAAWQRFLEVEPTGKHAAAAQKAIALCRMKIQQDKARTG